MKRLLMVAFQFPPFAGSSGIQRTLRFVQQLPDLGWEAIVLTAQSRAYETCSNDLLKEIPEGTVVERGWALDTSKHLALKRRYPSFLARPDRWVTWRFGAIYSGMRLIRRYRPQALWSTYPIATAHLIGADLHRMSGLPWIADFRDPMAQDGYPADPRTWQHFKEIEALAMDRAALNVFTSPGAARLYRERYPGTPPSRLRVIENGYDEESFAAIDSPNAHSSALTPGKITLLHSGVVYPSERDPTRLFAALRQLVDQGRIAADWLCIRLRASNHEGLLTKLAEQYAVEDLIDIVPPLPYRGALEEMLRADGLLVLQASNCNQQIPAKLYEYLRSRRPILGLTDPEGDTADVLRQAGVNRIARLDRVEEIAPALASFLDELKDGSAVLPNSLFVANATRRKRTEQFATLLEEIAS